MARCLYRREEDGRLEERECKIRGERERLQDRICRIEDYDWRSEQQAPLHGEGVGTNEKGVHSISKLVTLRPIYNLQKKTTKGRAIDQQLLTAVFIFISLPWS